MVRRCSYGLCNSDDRYPERLAGGIKFVPFSKPKTNYEKCIRWIKLCGRPHEQLNTSKIDKNRFICTKHFVDQKLPTAEFPDPLSADRPCQPPTPARKPPKKRCLGLDSQKISTDNVQRINTSVPNCFNEVNRLEINIEVEHGLTETKETQTCSMLMISGCICDITRKPYGIRMCLRQCRQCRGCKEFAYSYSDLSCHVTKGTQHPEGMTRYSNLKVDGSNAERQYICFEEKPKKRMKQRRTNSVSRTPEPEVLLAGNDEYSTLYRMLRLSTHTTTPYYTLRNGPISSLGWIPSTKTLLFSDDLSFRVDSSKFKSSKVDILFHGYRADDFAVDEDNQLLFIVVLSRFRRRRVIKMPLYKESPTYHRLMELEVYANPSIVAVPDYEILFVTDYDLIWLLSYDGKTQEEAVRHISVNGLAVDMEGRHLFYTDRKTLHKAAISEKGLGKSLQQWTLLYTPFRLLFVSEHVIASFQNTKEIAAVDLKDSRITYVDSGFSSQSQVRMCSLM